MDKAKVYFTDFRTTQDVSLTVKLQKLCRRAGIGEIPFEGKFTAIKMHFGELGNLAYLRPNYAKAVADVIKETGGLPFLTDCNTLYPGSRKNAVDHLKCAEMNGFNSVTTGCQTIIADGLKGTPNELKLKYLADNDFAHLSGEELKQAISESIKSKDADLVGNMASEGTTPRQLTDLIGSLCDLTSGSGDKGTPIVFIQGYFDNYTN